MACYQLCYQLFWFFLSKLMLDVESLFSYLSIRNGSFHGIDIRLLCQSYGFDALVGKRMLKEETSFFIANLFFNWIFTPLITTSVAIREYSALITWSRLLRYFAENSVPPSLLNSLNCRINRRQMIRCRSSFSESCGKSHIFKE